MKTFKKLFALVALLAMGTNAFAAAKVWYNYAPVSGVSVVVSETGGQTYTPVVDGKSPLTYTILYVKSNSGQNGIDVAYVSVAKNNTQMNDYTSIVIPEKVAIPVKVTDGTVKFDGTKEFTVTEIATGGFQDLNKLATVTINAPLTLIGASAFSGCVLEEITLPSALKTIGASAFAENNATDPVYNKFTSVTIPADVETIGAKAFEGCQLLTSVTLAADSKLNTIGSGAFSWTPISTLDLSSATKYKPANTILGMVQFGDGSGSPFTSTNHPTNAFIKKVVLPTTTATIGDYAFENCTVLKEINLEKVSTIGQNAFDGDIALTSVKIATSASKLTNIGAQAFNGCTKLATVELGKLESDNATTTTVVNNAFSGCTALTTFKFNAITAAGAVGTDGTASPYDLSSVNTLYFQTYITANGAIASGAFTNAFTSGGNIYYDQITVPNISTDFKQPFATDAFSGSGTPRPITLYTVLKQFTEANGFNTQDDMINKVTISAGYTTDYIIGNADKKLIKDMNSNDYYYYFEADVNRAIQKVQNGANVKVYQAYIDVVSDAANIYFMPLRTVGGNYVIEGGKIVIIKSDKEDGVKATTTSAASTMVCDRTGALINDLQITANAVTPLEVQASGAYMASGTRDLWFFNNPATSGFGFTKYDTEKQSGLNKGAVYMTCTATSSSRVNLVWLDEDSNVTAIETIDAKAPVANGVIYNLAGQKVGADYKGIVIKNGKKFFQK